MRRFDKRQLPALTLMAAIVCPSGLVFAQSSPVPAPDQRRRPLRPIPFQNPLTTSTTLPKSPPSPEQLGDALMAHQRYQAAIEAYKKAPPTIRLCGTRWASPTS